MEYRVTFEEVKERREIKVPCSVCGKKLRRVISSFQTLNPYNKNHKGLPKSREEIVAELRFEVNQLAKEPQKCRGCE